MAKKVTQAQADKVLQAVAAYLGRIGYGPEPGQPAPTGPDAANNGTGPMLKMDWDWPSGGPTPTILLEGGPYDWAIEIGWDTEFEAAMPAGIHTEPWAGYALCIYRED